MLPAAGRIPLISDIVLEVLRSPGQEEILFAEIWAEVCENLEAERNFPHRKKNIAEKFEQKPGNHELPAPAGVIRNNGINVRGHNGNGVADGRKDVDFLNRVM
jgi:hypothetical protein